MKGGLEGVERGVGDEYAGPGIGSMGSGTGIDSVFSTGTRVLPQPGAALGEKRNKVAPFFQLERAALQLTR